MGENDAKGGFNVKIKQQRPPIEMTSIGALNRDDLNDFVVTSSLPIQCGFMVGFLLGGYSAGQRASLQFLAENQHEMPRTRAQALLYHRNKNYRMMAAFGTGGMRRGLQLAGVAATFLLIKKALHVGEFKFNRYFDDLIAGSLVGSSFFLLSNRKQKFFHFKKGILLGSSLGASISLLKFFNSQFTR